MAANEALGLKRTPDYNGGDQEGTLLYQQMMRNGRRWSPVDAYLRPALGRQNLKVITHALVETHRPRGQARRRHHLPPGRAEP